MSRRCPEATVKQRRTTTVTRLKTFDNYALLIEKNQDYQIVRPTRLTPRLGDILQHLNLPTPAQI